MSKTDEDIKRGFAAFAGKHGPKTIIPAVVTAVNDDTTIAVDFSDGTDVPDCQLKSVVKNGNQVLFIPVVGSSVLVGSIENSSDYVVIAVDEISEMLVVIDDVKYSINDDGILIKKDDDTLRDALTLLIESVQQIIVIQGRGPDLIKLQQSLSKVQNLLRNA